MSRLARKELHDMLKSSGVNKDRTRDITLPASRIKGYPFSNAEINQEFHAYLKLASASSCIQIEWKTHYEDHEILRLRLLEPRGLAEFLGVPFRPDEVKRFVNSLDKSQLPDWAILNLGVVHELWLKDKPAFKIKWQDADRLVTVLNAIKAISTNGFKHALDYRQFGARFLGDSKKTKQIESSLAAFYKKHWESPELSDRDVMQALNIVPLSHPILLRGPVRFITDSVSLDSNIHPYIGIPDQLVNNFELSGEPDYVLTIENLSSFNEYTQNITDNCIVIYTGGFPNKSVQEFIKKLTSLTECDVFHWGDTDPHGFLILKTLQNCNTNRTTFPHLMNQPDSETYSDSAKNAMTKMMPINEPVDKLLEILISRGTGQIEQEEVAAIAPNRKIGRS